MVIKDYTRQFLQPKNKAIYSLGKTYERSQNIDNNQFNYVPLSFYYDQVHKMYPLIANIQGYSRLFKATNNLFKERSPCFTDFSYLSHKRRVANNRRVWKKYLNLINEFGTNGGPEIFVMLYKETFEISIFFRFFPNFFQK